MLVVGGCGAQGLGSGGITARPLPGRAATADPAHKAAPHASPIQSPPKIAARVKYAPCAPNGRALQYVAGLKEKGPAGACDRCGGSGRAVLEGGRCGNWGNRGGMRGANHS